MCVRLQNGSEATAVSSEGDDGTGLISLAGRCAWLTMLSEPSARWCAPPALGCQLCDMLQKSPNDSLRDDIGFLSERGECV